MKNPRPHHPFGFSIMPLPIFLVLGIIVGWIIHHYTGSLLIASIGGVVSFPASIWFLDLVFNNRFALRLQNYAGNHSCPTCQQRYDRYVSMPSGQDTLTLECSKCGAKHRFTDRHVHIEKVDSANETKSEQAVT
jgi:Zn ribbon nucleic-acid-binding protein